MDLPLGVGGAGADAAAVVDGAGEDVHQDDDEDDSGFCLPPMCNDDTQKYRDGKGERKTDRQTKMNTWRLVQSML